MRVIIRKTYEEISLAAANLVKARIKKKPELILGLATGSTPIKFYQELIRMYQEEKLRFVFVKSFNLDEYYGLSSDHPQSYRCFMNTRFFDHIDIDKANTHIPDGRTKDPEEFSAWYEEQIRGVGGIDLQLLGIGSDGHIGFNEPGSSFSSRTRLVALDAQTVSDNARFFERKGEVPLSAITMGIGTILEAKELILLASGERKADVVAAAIEGPLSSMVPASALQLHPRVTLFLDEAAASALTRKSYYYFAEESEQNLGRELF